MYLSPIRPHMGYLKEWPSPLLPSNALWTALTAPVWPQIDFDLLNKHCRDLIRCNAIAAIAENTLVGNKRIYLVK